MAEIQTTNSNLELIDELSQFDPELHVRIDMLRTGFSPNGETPNNTFSQAIDGTDSKAEREFINEYSWALSLAIYPYLSMENRHVLRNAAEDGLFLAGETYDPEQEPNFLKHLSATVRPYLAEFFGEVDTSGLPTADEFQYFVLRDVPAEAMLMPPIEKSEPPATDEPEPEAATAGSPAVLDPIGTQTAYTPKPYQEINDEPAVESGTISTPVEPDDIAPTDCPVSHLRSLGPERTIAFYLAGRLTRPELTAWAAHYPEEVPTINGEFEWIARNLVDLE